jgi:O-antigen/teichoic acid export membrane protein
MEPQAADAAAPDLLDTSAAGPTAIRGSTWRVVGYLAGLLLSVVASALLYRHLGPRGTGRYNVVINLVAIVAGFTDLGLTAIGVRELSVRRGQPRERLARSLLGMRIATSVIGVIVIAAFAIGVGYATTIVIGVVLAGLGLLLQVFQSTLTISLIADLRPGWVAAFDMLRTVLTSALIVGLVLVGSRLLPFFAVSIPVGLVVLAANLRVVRGRVPILPAFHAGEWWGIMRAALPFTLATAAATLYSQGAVIIVSLLAGADELGYFSLSVRAVQLLLVLPGLAISVALPIFARAARDDRVRLAYALGRTFEVSLLLGAFVALAVAVGAPIAVTIFGPKFAGSVPLLAIQSTGLGASFVGGVWANGLLGLGQYRQILAINVMGLVVGSALIVVLVLIDGVRGAAIATAVWEGAVVVLSGVMLVRADRLLMPPLWILPKVAIALGLAVLTTLLSLPVLASVVVASAVYLAAVVALGAVPGEVFAELRRVRRSLS